MFAYIVGIYKWIRSNFFLKSFNGPWRAVKTYSKWQRYTCKPAYIELLASFTNFNLARAPLTHAIESESEVLANNSVIVALFGLSSVPAGWHGEFITNNKIK